MIIDYLIPITSLFIAGLLLGAATLWTIQRIKLTHFKQMATDLILKAEKECDERRKAAELAIKHHQMEQQREFEKHWRQERNKIQTEEERLKQREDKLEGRMNLVEKKLSDLEKREAVLVAKQLHLDEEKQLIAEKHQELRVRLERTAGLSTTEAKEQLINQIAGDVKADAANLIRRTIREAHEEADNEARKIITTAINRLASQTVSTATVNTVTIPSDELKGRIIGREGRNIRALEQATGVNFMIDDTPGTVVLSCFDPVRLHIAKLALTDLVQDGRIHPTRIEEAVDKAKHDVQLLIKKYGEDAALRAGAINLHPELITLLGKLKFRFSYGQNILEHSLEVSHLMGLMAAELGLDTRLAKRIGLLHDMGKAVSHEIEGSHATVGHDLALKYGESKEVANGIGCHHKEMAPITVEGSLCSAADALSASRQGARCESAEEYIKRLKRLEEIAHEFPGVEKAYAMQAGREVRVVVLPDALDDDGTLNLARELTKRIEKELSYPGKIKITVIREKRIVEYAM